MRFTFVAKLVGADGQIVSRGFAEIPEAVAWLQNDGLAHLGVQRRVEKSVVRGGK
jgi:hypothetical protein